MGGFGSGRQKEQPLKPADLKKLKAGLDLATAAGIQEYLRRLDDLNLQGKIPAFRYKLAISSANAQRALIIEAEVDRRVAKVLKAKEAIVEARRGGRANRDVGPPPDALDGDSGPPAEKEP